MVIQAEPDEYERLARMLVPRRLGLDPSIVQALGGVALVCDELDMLAPQSAGAGVRALWQRGRHVGLSILGATQRPALVSRVVTAMSQTLVILPLHEPRDLAYVRELVPPDVFSAIAVLQRHHAVTWQPVERIGRLVDPKGFPRETWALG